MDVQTIDQSQAALPAAAVAPGASAAPAAQPAPSAHAPDAPYLKPPHSDETLHNALSHLVGGGSNVTVQFKISHGPNEIVTVFKNKDTGEVISEFPAESMVLIAQFFNKLAGAVVDRTA